jgi:hypothetical protein
MQTSKWFLPAVVVLGLIALYLYLRKRAADEAAARQRAGSAGSGGACGGGDPLATLGTLACTGGVSIYGGTAAGMGAAPVCCAAGGLLPSLVNGAKDTVVATLDTLGTAAGATAGALSGAATAPIKLLGGAFGFGGGSGGSFSGAIEEVFCHSTREKYTTAQIYAAPDLRKCLTPEEWDREMFAAAKTDCETRWGGKIVRTAYGTECDASHPDAAWDWKARGL